MWGLKPKFVNWKYRVIIPPIIITYGSFYVCKIFRHHIGLKTLLQTEHRVQSTEDYFSLIYPPNIIHSQWGLKPKFVNWMYTVMIFLILTYRSLVWLTPTKNIYTVKQLYRIQASRVHYVRVLLGAQYIQNIWSY